MADIKKLLAKLRKNVQNVRFQELHSVCVHYFDEPRQSGTSHQVFKTPWIGDPRVNIPNFKGKAKPYQIRQVLKAIERIENENNED